MWPAPPTVSHKGWQCLPQVIYRPRVSAGSHRLKWGLLVPPHHGFSHDCPDPLAVPSLPCGNFSSSIQAEQALDAFFRVWNVVMNPRAMQRYREQTHPSPGGLLLPGTRADGTRVQQDAWRRGYMPATKPWNSLAEGTSSPQTSHLYPPVTGLYNSTD